MRFFLDTEFNGFGGKLMSMALVPESGPYFYREIEMTDQLHPWVAENVVPHMHFVPCTYKEFQHDLSKYLKTMNSWDSTCTIIADWPDDVRYFCEALITGPGECMLPSYNINFELDFTIEYISDVPHNALHDAMGIRKFYLERLQKNEQTL